MQLRTAKILVQDTCCHEQSAPCDAGEFFLPTIRIPTTTTTATTTHVCSHTRASWKFSCSWARFRSTKKMKRLVGTHWSRGQLHDDLQGGHELGGSASQVAVPLNPTHAKPSKEHSSATLPVPQPVPVPVAVPQPQAEGPGPGPGPTQRSTGTGTSSGTHYSSNNGRDPA